MATIKEIPGLARDEADRPDEATTRLLVDAYGYRLEAVRLWSKARATTVLANCKREDRIVARRSAEAAAKLDDKGSRQQPSKLDRVVAANYLTETLETGTIEELTQAFMYSAWVLTDDETRRLVGYVVRLLRGEGKPVVATVETSTEIPE